MCWSQTGRRWSPLHSSSDFRSISASANPNDFDLRFTGIDFTLDLNGKRLARGVGNKERTVPRLSDAVFTVQTSTSTFDILHQVLSVSQKQELAYNISGVLHSHDSRLSFDSSGVLCEKVQSSGSSFP